VLTPEEELRALRGISYLQKTRYWGTQHRKATKTGESGRKFVSGVFEEGQVHVFPDYPEKGR
jgi:hypothetical protein